MAASLLRHALAGEDAPLNTTLVESAGVASVPGEPASSNSIAVLKKANLDISKHKSQPVTQALIDHASIILGMTDSHIHALFAQKYLNLTKHVYLFREFMSTSGKSSQILDPFGQDFRSYQESFDSMIEAIPSLVTFIKKLFV